ncbi:MAG: hypothetical protein K0U08_05765 [Proteobacteria bacterium]|nr:hypothetical protein [Pseudomonadota bacterium]MCH9711361.1 hypothetical protein [Pseudomonadota bacterium]MCH9749334.1 hypothetical protein [Pseudomonadota bacterium]
MHSFVLGVFSFLIFILSVNGTMALRNTLAVVLLVLLVTLVVRGQANLHSIFKNKEFHWILGSLVVFVLYVLFHSIYLSHEMLWSLSEFKSHIFYPFLYFSMGIVLASYVSKSEQITKETLITILFYSIFIHILYIDLVAIDKLFHDGIMMRRYGGLMDSPVQPNYLTNILLAMIIAEFVYRLRVKKQILKVSNGVLYLLLIACIFSTFVEALRLGDIALVFLGIGSSMAFLYKNNQYSVGVKRFIATSLIIVLTIPLAYNLNTDPRWAKLIETIPLAMDTSNSMHWLDRSQSVPKTESGYEVKGSNYERIAWVMKALEYSIEEPMGVGFGRNAFGHAMEDRHGALAKRGGTAHSSILDLTVGAGVFATLLWLFFVYRVAKVAVNQFETDYDYFSLLSLFLIMGYVGRGFVDANMRDHMFLQFMIILGISVYYMIVKKDKTLVAK